METILTRFLIGALSLAFVTPVLAAGTGDTPAGNDAPPPAVASPAAQPQMDMGRTVELTGHEVQALMRAAATQATAQAAAQAAAAANEKVQRALMPADTAKPHP